jgi:hypothetical protein
MGLIDGVHYPDRDWHEGGAKAMIPPPLQPYTLPAPSVTSTLVDPGDSRIPTSCRRAYTLATANRWSARITRSRGPYIGDGGRVLDLEVPCLALRADRVGFRVVMSWVYRGTNPTWKFDGAWILDPRIRPVDSAAALDTLREG